MLIHSPLGLGHPYRHEPDQRIPIRPTSGDVWTVRARTDESTKKITLYLADENEVQAFELTCVGQAHSSDFGPYGKTAKFTGTNTHLADAAARSGEYSDELAWEVVLPVLEEFQEVSYWLESDTSEKTETFTFCALVWSSDDGFLKQSGQFPTGISLMGPEVLKDSQQRVYGVRASLSLAPEDHVVGFGERFHSVDQRGELVDAVVYEEYKGQGHRTYLPAPFGMVIESNYGFYLNTGNPSRFDVGVTNKDRITFELDIDPSQSTCEIRAYCGTPSSILSQYMSEFPLPKNPPAWIYKLWGSSNEWNTQERVEAELSKSADAKIDLGVIVIEAWADETTFTVFRDAQYEPTDGSRGLRAIEIEYPHDGAWPNPKQMINDIHAQGAKVILWQNPVIKDMRGEPEPQEEAIWKYAIDNDLVVKDGEGDPYRVRGFWLRHGLLPDLTDKRVRAWWADLHKYLVTDLGVDGFKTDGGEHAWGTDLRYLDGRSGLEKNNLLPVAYAQTFHELFTEAKKEGVTFSRAGFAGSSSYPTFWAGDEDSTWNAYRASVRAGISASASGIFFWGWDIGGFSGELPSAELYLRGAAMATFCPIMQFHSEYNHHRKPSNDRSPWNIAEQTGTPEVITVFREFAEVRKRLLPYLSVEGEIAIDTGRPLMAGLFFDYAQDDSIWAAPYQYMLGRYLLVAPVIEENTTSIRVYLPEGDWVDFWDCKKWTGKQWIDVETPIDRIPVFIKADAPEHVHIL
ncbi:MAG: glycoside hydrolase family 31 protein [Candidatus Nanopelagicaceae bacterium]|nr:glycoside hydrolase family 31 protein [Candidatus Nanopelagicaceae bacterium]